MKWLCFFLICFSTINCTTFHQVNSNTSTLQFPAFDKEGHRGCRGWMPENTVPAMLKAIDLGVTTLEMDAVITSDHQVILSHDTYFNHAITTKPDGSYVNKAEEKSLNIYQMTYEQVKTFDVGMKPYTRFPKQQKLKAVKPLLTHVIDSVDAYCGTKSIPPVFFNIETKSQPSTDNSYHPAPQLFVDLLMQVVQSKGIEERVIIQSFDFRTLQYLHQKYPSIKTAMLVEFLDKRSLEEQLQDLGFVPTIYSPEYLLVNAALVKKCHEQQMKVIPWTINRKTAIKRLKKLGVDGIITDYPDLLQ